MHLGSDKYVKDEPLVGLRQPRGATVNTRVKQLNLLSPCVSVSGLVGQVELGLLQAEGHTGSLRHHLQCAVCSVQCAVCRVLRLTIPGIVKLIKIKSLQSHLAVDTLVRLYPDHQFIPDTLALEDVPRDILVLDPHLKVKEIQN